MIRFAIIKDIGKAEARTVLEYDSDQICTRMQARVREQLTNKETVIKHKFTQEEVKAAIAISWNDLVAEFKEQTLVLK